MDKKGEVKKQITKLHGKQGIKKNQQNKRVVHKWRIQNFKYFHNAVFYF